MMCEIFDGHLLVLSVRTIEPVALSRRPGLPAVRVPGTGMASRLSLRPRKELEG